MGRRLRPRTSIVFFGLDGPLAAELKNALSGPTRMLRSEPLASVSECRRAIDGLGADLAFCPAEGKNYRILLEAVRESRRGLPVVVVSRHARVTEWLDALEDGAADYCAAPFEAIQMRWILEGCLGPKRTVSGSANEPAETDRSHRPPPLTAAPARAASKHRRQGSRPSCE